jgi:hypothetical protein
LCSTSVLTGQDGMIQFRPPGTSQCVADFSSFGTDGDITHITVPCSHDFRVNDAVLFAEVNGANLDSALSPSVVRADIVEGEILTLGNFVEGSAYQDGVYNAVSLTGGFGTGATADITVASGRVTGVALVSGGSGYRDTDQLSAAPANLGGSGSGFTIEVGTVFSSVPVGDACYYVVAKGDEWISVSTVMNGPAISMRGDGGTGSEDTELPAHILIELCDWYTVCNVRSFSAELSRDELDITTLPCDTGVGCDKLAQFRATQAGYAELDGTMEVYFTCDQDNIANRLLGASLLKSQQGARAKLYVCSQTDGTGQPDDSSSLFIDIDIAITGMSFEVNPDDPTTAELTFKATRVNSAFGMST